MIASFPRFGPPPDASLDGHRVDALFSLTTALTGGFLLIILAVLAVLLVRYRARAGHRARYVRGESRLHTGGVAALAMLVFVALDVQLARIAHADLDATAWRASDHPNALRVEVMAQQFVWSARYAGADGRFATADDPLSLGEMRVPVNTPVRVGLIARDVIHSFFVPAFRIKRDAIPGRVTHTWFEATRTGRFEIACAQLCGFGHYTMRGVVTVVSRADFDAWLAERAWRSQQLFDPRDAGAHWGWDWVE